MLARLSRSLLCTLILFGVAASLPARAQGGGHPPSAPTSTSISCSPFGPVSQGEPIPLVAIVTSSSGIPTGKVNFTQNDVSIGAASLDNGTASLNAFAVAGFNSFVATFPQQSGYASSSATCDLQAGPLALHSNNNPALAYSSITFIAVFSIQPFPGGTFTFSFNGGPPMIATGGGRNPSEAFYTTDTLAAGTYTVTAIFSPSDGSAPYTATITQVVTAAPQTLPSRAILPPSPCATASPPPALSPPPHSTTSTAPSVSPARCPRPSITPAPSPRSAYSFYSTTTKPPHSPSPLVQLPLPIADGPSLYVDARALDSHPCFRFSFSPSPSSLNTGGERFSEVFFALGS